jgi:lactate dehydrogenase-like 2-hydroxyacid dehydrogenase
MMTWNRSGGAFRSKSDSDEECKNLGLRYRSLPERYAASDIITRHCPLTSESHHRPMPMH